MSAHIRLSPASGSYLVRAGTEVIGRSDRAVHLNEGSAAAVIYVPRADVDVTRLVRTDRHTSCPWKGDASYYSVTTANGTLENAVWSYETPKTGLEGIAGLLAFYPNKVAVTQA